MAVEKYIKYNNPKKLKIGLALGGGSAKGIAHIGVLKVLHKHKIYPDYLAGTSMGAVIAAAYAAGNTPEEIEEIIKATNWKDILDFTVPKSGLIKGNRIEHKIRKLVKNKKFDELNTPLRIVAYNLDTSEKVVFKEGDVARSIRASLSLPGIFAPVKIGRYRYIDGAVADPTPYDIVKEMGADIIIAVDLYVKEKTVSGPYVKEKTLYEEFKQQFVSEELLNLKKYLIPDRWPDLVRDTLGWIFDKLLYPAKVIRIMAGRELPPITKVAYSTFNILLNNLAKERMKNPIIDIKITPEVDGRDFMNFDQVDKMVKTGEKAMALQLPKLRNKLNGR